MAVNVRPLADRVIVKPLEASEVKKGGIIIPDAHKEKLQEGEVVAPDPGMGDHPEHERNRDRGQLRACVTTLHRFLRRRLHRSGYISLSSSTRAGVPGQASPRSCIPSRPGGRGCRGPDE